MFKKKVPSEEDFELFFEAAENRITPRSKSKIIAEIEKKNSYRWWRIRHDYKWLKRQLKRMGYNPDEAKELL